jgi:predicted membrane protein
MLKAANFIMAFLACACIFLNVIALAANVSDGNYLEGLCHLGLIGVNFLTLTWCLE